MTWIEIGFMLAVFALGVLLGAIGASYKVKKDYRGLPEANAVLREKLMRLPALESELTVARQEARQFQQRAEEQRASIADLMARLEMVEQQYDEKVDLLLQAREEMNQAFRTLAAEALRSNNQTFVDLAQATLARYQSQAETELEKRQIAVSELVKPLKESLTLVNDKIYELEKNREGAYRGLSEQVLSMAAGQEKLQRETARLVMALKTPAVRGRWGEIQLKRVAELAGMLEHCDFEQQAVSQTEEGMRRPDLIVRLPGHKSVVVDAKVPLGAYMEAIEASDEEKRLERLQTHARQVRSHIAKLTGKAYWQSIGFTPEFVVMFLPGEMLFSAALEQDPSLLEYGAEQRVIIATPTTLIALLKTVAYGWQQEQLTENAYQIQVLGQELYERTQGLVSHLEDVGRGLRKTIQAYNQTIGTFESRVLVSVRRFQEMGISAKERIPTQDPINDLVREVRVPAAAPAETEEPERDA